MRLYPAFCYATRENADASVSVICSTAMVGAANWLEATEHVLRFSHDEFPDGKGYGNHAAHLADMQGYQIVPDPSITDLSPGYHVFFVYVGRVTDRQRLEVRSVYRVVHCQNSLGEGYAQSLTYALERLPPSEGWHKHLSVMVDSAGFSIVKEDPK